MVVFTLFLPTVISLLIYWNLPHTATILPPLDTDVSWTRMGFLPAYATYYFLGSYLNQQEVGKKARIVSYLLGISAYLFCPCAHLLSRGKNRRSILAVVCRFL